MDLVDVDRIVIEATAARVEGSERAVREARRRLEKMATRVVRTSRDRVLRDRQAKAGKALMDAAFSSAVSPYPGT